MKLFLNLLIVFVIGTALWFFIGLAVAAPFVVSDPTLQGVTHCGSVLDGGVKVDSIVAVSPLGKSCKIDIGTAGVGTHSIAASFVNIDPIYGRVESAMSVPFVFVVPSGTINAPGALKLVP